MSHVHRLPLRNSTTTRFLRYTSLFLSLVLLLSSLCMSLTGCNSKEKKQNQTVVATCNGFDIKYEELRFLTLLYKESMAASYGAHIWDDPATAETYRAELEEMVQKHLNENYVILTTCLAYYVDLEDPKADAYADTQIDTLIKKDFEGKKKEYRAWLKQHHMSESYFHFSLEVSYLESVLYYTLLDGGFFDYDSTNIDAYVDYVLNDPAYARTLHVFIRNNDGESPEQNLATAQQISQALHAVSNVKQREEIMRSYIGSAHNDDLNLVSEDGYYFTHGEMDEVYEDVVFGLEVGEVSEAFACNNGYFVVMRLQPESDYVLTNCATLLRNYQAAVLGLTEDSFRDACVVEYNEYGKSIDLLTIE